MKNNRTVKEPAKSIPVRDEAEVLVCGGGLGGIAAAIGASRAGARTLLIDRNSFVGGVATAGMCCSIFNCYYTSERKLGTEGIALEVADALAEAEGYGRKWRSHKGHIIYDVERAELVLLDLLERAGVNVLVNAVTADTIMDGQTLKGVIVESKSGREAVLARAVVDATGDADVAQRAGAPVRVFENGIHTLCFRMANVEVDEFVNFFRANPDQYAEYMDVDWSLDEALAQYDDCGTFLFPHGGGMQMQALQQARASGDLPERVGVHDSTDACQMHALRRIGVAHINTGFAHFNGLDAERISRSIHDGRRMAFIVADVYRKYIPGFADAFIAGTAANLGVRTSRYLEGDFVFTDQMMAAGVRQPDAVGRCVGWDLLVKHPGRNAWGSQVCRSDTFDLPYRCLLPRRVEGLLVGSGRSTSSENPYLLRAMVYTMVAGQGAGVAAAVAAKTASSPRAVNIASVQEELRRQNVKLG